MLAVRTARELAEVQVDRLGPDHRVAIPIQRQLRGQSTLKVELLLSLVLGWLLHGRTVESQKSLLEVLFRDVHLDHRQSELDVVQIPPDELLQGLLGLVQLVPFNLELGQCELQEYRRGLL